MNKWDLYLYVDADPVTILRGILFSWPVVKHAPRRNMRIESSDPF